MKNSFLLAGIAALMLSACNNKPAQELTLSGLNPVNFQTEVNNAKTGLYTLKNKSGMEVCITNFGGRIVSIMVPDKNGNMQDVVLGFDSIADYVNIPSDFGASIGRYANRINQGRIVLDGETIQLPQNNFGHCLHGGPKGLVNTNLVFLKKTIALVSMKLRCKELFDTAVPKCFRHSEISPLGRHNLLDLRCSHNRISCRENTVDGTEFKAFGALWRARNEYGESRKKVSDELYISATLRISRTRDNSRVYRYSMTL